MALRALESNKKIGRLIVSLLGTAWTAMTFFVVPVIIIAFAVLWGGFAVGTTLSIVLGLGAFVILILLLTCFGAAEGTVFKAMLHCYATGKGLPEEISTRDFAEAFCSN